MLAALRRVIALLILTAYVSAAMVQHVPFAHAMPGDMGAGMAQHQDDPSNRMPCKSTPQPCVTYLGCIPTLLTLTTWASVIYPGVPEELLGRSIKPALGPPISLT
jgi:hypothetical protein